MGSASARRAPLALAISMARATAAAWPAITTCPGALKLTASTTSPCEASRQASSMSMSSSPRIAAMAPCPGGTAACINSPRYLTRSTAVLKSRQPAATSAVNSPRLWPAIMHGLSTAARAPQTISGDSGRQHCRLSAFGGIQRLRPGRPGSAAKDRSPGPRTLRRRSLRSAEIVSPANSSCRWTANLDREKQTQVTCNGPLAAGAVANYNHPQGQCSPDGKSAARPIEMRIDHDQGCRRSAPVLPCQLDA